MLNVKVSNKLHNKWPGSGNKEVLASAQKAESPAEGASSPISSLTQVYSQFLN